MRVSFCVPKTISGCPGETVLILLIANGKNDHIIHRNDLVFKEEGVDISFIIPQYLPVIASGPEIFYMRTDTHSVRTAEPIIRMK